MKFSELIRYYPFVLYNKIMKNKFSNSNNQYNTIDGIIDIKKYAKTHTKYYKENFDFPVINKSIIQRNLNEFISNEYHKEELIKVTTSGSYGTPSIFYRNNKKKMKQISDVLYYGSLVNYYFGVRHAFIRGVEKSKNLCSYRMRFI